MRLAAPFILAACMATAASAQSGPTGHGPTLLLHGNYCGPGNNAPAAPIDALDAACARHDACTPSGGLSSRACNAHLQRDADAVARDPRQPEDLRTLAGLVSSGAAILPSDPSLASAPVSGPAVQGGEHHRVMARHTGASSLPTTDLDD